MKKLSGQDATVRTPHENPTKVEERLRFMAKYGMIMSYYVFVKNQGGGGKKEYEHREKGLYYDCG